MNLGKVKLANYLGLIINIGLTEPISNELPHRNDMGENITTDILMEHFIEGVDKVLTSKS